MNRTADIVKRRYSHALLSRIEDAGLNASAPPQQRWIDGWMVRFSSGKAKRARCINALSDGWLPVEERIALCEDVYRQAGLPLVFRITPFSQPTGLDVTLERLGLQRIEDTRVMVCADLHPFCVPELPEGMSIEPVGLPAFAQRIGAMRGSPLAQRLAHAERLENAPVPFCAFELKRDGDVQACGQFAIEADLVGLYDVFTAPEARGQGHARTLCEHMLAHARSRGARTAYLQVDHANLPARAVYHRLGFADGYAYHYRVRVPPDA